MKNSGFTLIEVLISIAIMAFIAVAIYTNTSQGFSLREKLEQDSDFYNSLRVAFDLIGRDFSQIYTPQAAALPGKLGKADTPTQGATSGTGITSNISGNTGLSKFWADPINAVGVRPSRFNGEATKVTFVTSSHMRIYRDSPESHFAKITYSLEDDKLAEKDAKALVKRENPDVFGDKDVEDKEVKYTLLANVKSIKFQYLDGEKDTWHSRWDTVSVDHQNKFPSVIEMEIELLVPVPGQAEAASDKRSTFKIKQRFRPELTL